MEEILKKIKELNEEQNKTNELLNEILLEKERQYQGVIFDILIAVGIPIILFITFIMLGIV